MAADASRPPLTPLAVAVEAALSSVVPLGCTTTAAVLAMINLHDPFSLGTCTARARRPRLQGAGGRGRRRSRDVAPRNAEAVLAAAVRLEK